MPQCLDRAASDALAQRLQSLIEAQGWGVWAVALRESGVLIGMVGLHRTALDLPCAPCVELIWRLAAAHWHQGYATEAARAALDFGLTVLNLPEVVAFTAVVNQPSQAVMVRLNMQPDPAPFAHPALPVGHALRSHVLYRMTAAAPQSVKAA